MTVVSIDPGDSTGVCLWEDDGSFIRKFKLPHDDFVEWADSYPMFLSRVVVEDFRLRRGQRLNVQGSKLVAAQGIGVSQALAKRFRVPLAKQSPQVLQIAAMHAGVPIVSHFSDDMSAYLHGYYWFETQGIRLPKLQENR